MEKSGIIDKDVAEADYKFDWCEKGVIADVVKNQAKGHVCWAFCTICAIEAINQIATRKMITLSEQHLIDCDHNNKGYTFGDPRKAFSYILEKEGVVYKDSDYKLRGGAGKCECSKYKPAATIDGYAKVTPIHDENELKKAVKRQLVTSSIDVRYLENYKGSIIDFDHTLDLDTISPPLVPEKIPRHGLVIVGFGRENDIDYWKCRCAYGPTMGENGYFRIRRNVPNYPDAFRVARKCFYPWKKGVNQPAGK